MPVYEISNPTSNNLSLRTGPNVIYVNIGSLLPGRKGRGDFIMTYQSPLTIDGTQRGQTGDQWIHVTQLDGAPVDGWIAIKHLGRAYATYVVIPDSPPPPSTGLDVSFNVDLDGYQPITLTGRLNPK